MKKIVLFDLGQTLEDSDRLLPGAADLLDSIERMMDSDCVPPVLGLVSDFFPASSPQEVVRRQNEYYAILDQLDIRSHFEPVAERVTLSTEVRVGKPDPFIFRAAIDKIEQGADFNQVIFITENLPHVTACRNLGMRAIHFKGPGQSSGDVDHLSDVAPLIQAFVEEK